eukprot:3024605-Lingulodinium_polyedra.AAC.1
MDWAWKPRDPDFAGAVAREAFGWLLQEAPAPEAELVEQIDAFFEARARNGVYSGSTADQPRPAEVATLEPQS